MRQLCSEWRLLLPTERNLLDDRFMAGTYPPVSNLHEMLQHDFPHNGGSYGDDQGTITVWNTVFRCGFVRDRSGRKSGKCAVQLPTATPVISHA